jgi:hypothetical protein
MSYEVHFMNFVSFCLQFITKNCIKKGQIAYKRFSNDVLGVFPSIHEYIINRTMMEKPDFIAYLRENHKWWLVNHYKNEDWTFFDCFTKDIIQELIQLRKDYANPEIQIEITLGRIISFLRCHLAPDTPKKNFFLFLQCLSSKCFHFDRKGCGKKWKSKKETYLLDYLKENEKYIRIQSFFFANLVGLPTLSQEIENLRENDARMFDAMTVGFKLMTTLFLKKNIPFDRISPPMQQQICESTSSLMYLISRDTLIGYQVLQKFYPVQNMHPKFRRFLVGKGTFLFFLVWRLFHLNDQNNLRRIPNSFVAKLMMTKGFLPKFDHSTPHIKRFLCIL